MSTTLHCSSDKLIFYGWVTLGLNLVAELSWSVKKGFFQASSRSWKFYQDWISRELPKAHRCTTAVYPATAVVSNKVSEYHWDLFKHWNMMPSCFVYFCHVDVFQSRKWKMQSVPCETIPSSDFSSNLNTRNYLLNFQNQKDLKTLGCQSCREYLVKSSQERVRLALGC